MKILVAGDTHRFYWSVESKVKIAKRLGCQKIMIVGDFGLWRDFEGVTFLDMINEVARANDIQIYALPGNHEDHPLWEKYLNMGLPKDRAGFTYVRSNVLLSKRIHNWKWNNKRFFIAGGAASIDRAWRKAGVDWFPEEVLSDAEVLSIESYGGPDIDYLFTHDASDHTNWGFELIPDPDSKLHRQKIDRVIAAVRPHMQFHGHMHRKYDWVNTYSHGQRKAFGEYDNTDWNGKSTLTYGLDCNDNADSWGVLDTNADKFYWPEAAVKMFDPAFQ